MRILVAVEFSIIWRLGRPLAGRRKALALLNLTPSLIKNKKRNELVPGVNENEVYSNVALEGM